MPQSRTKCLSILLVVCGILMMILQIVIIVEKEESSLRGMHYFGWGVWCGFVIVLSGIIGCCAASKKTKALV